MLQNIQHNNQLTSHFSPDLLSVRNYNIPTTNETQSQLIDNPIGKFDRISRISASTDSQDSFQKNQQILVECDGFDKYQYQNRIECLQKLSHKPRSGFLDEKVNSHQQNQINQQEIIEKILHQQHIELKKKNQKIEIQQNNNISNRLIQIQNQIIKKFEPKKNQNYQKFQLLDKDYADQDSKLSNSEQVFQEPIYDKESVASYIIRNQYQFLSKQQQQKVYQMIKQIRKNPNKLKQLIQLQKTTSFQRQRIKYDYYLQNQKKKREKYFQQLQEFHDRLQILLYKKKFSLQSQLQIYFKKYDLLCDNIYYFSKKQNHIEKLSFYQQKIYQKRSYQKNIQSQQSLQDCQQQKQINHQFNKYKLNSVQVPVIQKYQKQKIQKKPHLLFDIDNFNDKSSNKSSKSIKESQSKIITNKPENQSSKTSNYTRPSTQNKNASTNRTPSQKSDKEINFIKKQFSDSQSQDQHSFIQKDYNIIKKKRMNNYLRKGKLQNPYTRIFYKDQTLKNIQSVNQLKFPSNADKHQKQRKADRENKNIKQTSQMILKDKKYPKKDLYLPTLQQVRIYDKTYQKDIQKNLLKMKQEITVLQKDLKQLKEPSKLQSSKRIKQLQSQVKTVSTFYVENLKPQINKINSQSKKYLFQEFYQNFTTVQTQLYEFFQFNSNIIIKNKQLRNNQKRIRQPIEYFKLIENQLKSNQNKKLSYIEIKNWQKMKKYFQNPTQEFQKKFKFLISPILNRNVYCWNKIYNKFEKKFQINKHIQQFQQTSVIQLPVNTYSLSYVVMVCLEITQKKKLLSQIEDLRSMSQRIVENIFEKPKDKELKMEKQFKNQIKYNEMLSKEDVLLEEQITKKVKMYELELETWMLLVKFVEELIKKIIKIEYRQDYTRRKAAEKFLIDFIENFYLYNYLVNVYENQYGKMLNFKYFITLINRQNKKESQQNYSHIETKLNVFWQSFFYIQLVEQTQKYQIAYLQQKVNSHYRSNVLKFVYLRCISQELGPQSQQRIKKVKQVKQINQIKQLKLNGQTKKLPEPKYFNFQLFYNDIYPIKSQNDMIQLETKYMVHLSQYCQQIIAELSQTKNISLDVVFNSIRFMQINLILHFTNLCFDEIQRSIQKSCGRIHKKNFIQYRNKNDKWIDCTNKSIKAIDLAYKKLLTYIQQITNPQKLRQSANVQKIKKMLQEQQEMMSVFLAFNIDTTKVRSIERFEHLSDQQKIMSIKHIFDQNFDRDQQLLKYLKKNYNQYNLAKRYENVKTIRQFQEMQNRPKYLYRFIIEQLGKEYFSTKIMEKTFKKLLKKHLGESAAKNYDFKKYSKNLKFIYVQEEKNYKNGTPMFRKDFDKFQKQWVISIIQTIKLSSLVVTLPFYSFQTERENERIRYGRIFNNDLRRKQPKKLFQIMKTLDLFYIYKAERLNTIYMQDKCNFDEILQIKLKYLKYTKRISQFFQQLRQTSFSAYSTQFEPIKDFRYIQELQLVQPTPIQSIPYNYLLALMKSLYQSLQLSDLQKLQIQSPLISDSTIISQQQLSLQGQKESTILRFTRFIQKHEDKQQKIKQFSIIFIDQQDQEQNKEQIQFKNRQLENMKKFSNDDTQQLISLRFLVRKLHRFTFLFQSKEDNYIVQPKTQFQEIFNQINLSNINVIQSNQIIIIYQEIIPEIEQQANDEKLQLKEIQLAISNRERQQKLKSQYINQ